MVRSLGFLEQQESSMCFSGRAREKLSQLLLPLKCGYFTPSTRKYEGGGVEYIGPSQNVSPHLHENGEPEAFLVLFLSPTI